MESKTLQNKFNNIILSGHFKLQQIKNIKDKDIDKVIDILISCVDNIPNIMLLNISLNIDSHMVPLSMGIFLARANSKTLNQNEGVIYNILDDLNPQRLLYTIEFLKSKHFGRGFGSKYQKMIRKIMESWDAATLTEIINIQPCSLNDLLNIIHPKYSGERGKIIKEFLKMIREIK